MALEISDRALLESRKARIEPQLVLEIEGVTTLFGAIEISRLIRVGDPGLVIGDSWKIGGVTPVEDQAQIISFEAGSSTSISQQLQPEKGSVSSVTSVQVALIDKNLIASRLISPGIVVDDILGKKAILWMGFKGTAFKDDYVPIMAGIIDDIDSGAGNVKLNISSPEQLKRQSLFTPVNLTATGSVDISQTTIDFEDASLLMVPTPGPLGDLDPAITFFVKIDDEFIQYTGVSGNSITGCTRGALATIAAVHTVSSDPLTAVSLLQIQDTSIDIALKLMLSGVNDYYTTDVKVSQYLHPDPFTLIPNSVYFDNIDLNRDFGTVEGDFITLASAINGANNCTMAKIDQIVVVDGGSYAVIHGVSFVDEPDTTATASFRSQYDTLGYGLGMTPDQVDVAEHVFWRNTLLASYSYRFVIQDVIQGKDFLDKEVYLPIGAFSLPRKGRCSMGYHVGPIIREKLRVINRGNIKDPDKIRLRRTINKNFYNVITYQFEEVALTKNFVTGFIQYADDSQTRIPVGNKALQIVSKGMRRALDGEAIAESVSLRYLGRYKFGAEFFETVGLLFRDGYPLEPGDVVLLDATQLNITNTVDGTRNKAPKIFTVLNKSLDLKTGDVKLALTDTNFDDTERYGAISPSSLIVSGTTTKLVIEDSFGAIFPGNESLKWADYVGLDIIVHSPDWSFAETVTFIGIDPGNKYRLLIDPATPLSVAPLAGYIIDIADYPDNTDKLDQAQYKAVHSYMGSTVAIATSLGPTTFLVSPGDESKFSIGSSVRVHNADFSLDSNEVLGDHELTIVDIAGNVITVSENMGFTPSSGFVAEGMNFPDGGRTYRIF